MIKIASPSDRIESLPVEILVQVFIHVRDGSSDNPDVLDRLRLVCRWWNRAVLDSSILWSTIKLKFGSRSIDFWLPYTLKCLRLAGPTCPLDLELGAKGDSKWWPEYPKQRGGYEAYCKIAVALTGEKGEIAARWRSVYFASYSGFNYVSDRLFAFSVPRLETFSAHNLSTRHGAAFLPHAPLLRHLHLHMCAIPTLRDFLAPHIRTLRTLGLQQYILDSPRILDLLPCATNVSTLRIGGVDTYSIPPGTVLPALRNLTIFDVIPESLEHLSAPNLETFCLLDFFGISIVRDYLRLSMCAGIPFAIIRTFRLACPHGSRLDITEAFPHLPSFLKSLSGVELLEVCCGDACKTCKAIALLADEIFEGRVTILVS